jgi:MFS family permease
MLIGVCTGA